MQCPFSHTEHIPNALKIGLIFILHRSHPDFQSLSMLLDLFQLGLIECTLHTILMFLQYIILKPSFFFVDYPMHLTKRGIYTIVGGLDYRILFQYVFFYFCEGTVVVFDHLFQLLLHSTTDQCLENA